MPEVTVEVRVAVVVPTGAVREVSVNPELVALAYELVAEGMGAVPLMAVVLSVQVEVLV